MVHNNNNQIRGNWFSSIAEKSDFNMTISNSSSEPQKLQWEIGDILTNTVTGERWIAYELTDMWWTDIVTGEKYEYPTLKLFNGTTGESQNWRVDRLTRAYFYNETDGDPPPHNLDQLLKEEATNDLEDHHKSKINKKKGKEGWRWPHHNNQADMMPTAERLAQWAEAANNHKI